MSRRRGFPVKAKRSRMSFDDYDRWAKRGHYLPAVKVRWLLVLAQAGDRRAAEMVIQAHARLAVWLAWRRFKWLGIPIEDAVGYAMTGLVATVYRFNVSRPYRFKSFVGYRCCQAMKDGARVWRRQILRVSDDRQPAIESDTPLTESSWSDILPPTAIDFDCERSGRQAALRQWIAETPLTDRQRAVLEKRFDPDTGDERDFARIASELDISRQRVHELYLLAVAKLKSRFKTLPAKTAAYISEI